MKRMERLSVGFMLLWSTAAWAWPETFFTPNRFRNTIVEVSTGEQRDPAVIPVPSFNTFGPGAMVIYRDNSMRSMGDLVIRRLKNDGSNYAPYVINSSSVNSLDKYGIAPSFEGGSIVCWVRGSFIYASRRDAGGAAYTNGGWYGFDSGKVIITSSYNKLDFSMISDGAGGAILCWRENRSSYYHVYVQRVDANGYILWGMNGRGVLSPAPGYNMFAPKIVFSDANSGIVTWYDGHAGYANDIYAQRVQGSDSAGFSLMWGSSGVSVTMNMAGDQSLYNLCPDDSGGAFVAFLSANTDKDIYVQRVTLNGARRNGSGGLLVCNAAGDQTVPVMANFSSPNYGKEIYLAWADPRNYATSGNDIYAMRVFDSTLGMAIASSWNPTSGVAVCMASGDQFSPRIALDTVSVNPGVMVAWGDPRDSLNSGYNIFAGRYTHNAAKAAGWTLSNGIPISEAPGYQPNDRTWESFRVWRDPNNTRDFMYLWNTSLNGTDLLMQKENQAGNFIDRVPPDVPVLFPEPDSNNITPQLDWYASNGATHYRIELSDNPAFTPLLVSDSAFGNYYYVPYGKLGSGTYYWRVSANDDGGNKSNFSYPDTFKIDTFPPYWTNFTVYDGDTISSKRPFLRASMVDNGIILPDTSTLVMTLDGSVVTHTVTSPNYVSYTPTADLQDMAWHRVTWFVKDSAGNGGMVDTAVVNFYINASMNDMSPPSFNTPFPAQSSTTNKTADTLLINVSDPSGVDGSSANLLMVINNWDTIRTVTYESALGRLNSVQPCNFNEGYNYVLVRARDLSANYNMGSFGWSFYRDATPPAAPSLNSLPSLTNYAYQMVSGNGETKAQVELYVNAALAGTKPVGSGYYYQFDSVLLASGRNIVAVRQIDSAGNAGPYSRDTVDVDVAAPGAPVLSALPAYTRNSLLTVRGAVERKSYVQVFVNGSQANYTTMGAGDTFSLSVTLSMGSNAITSKQTDSAGNQSSECQAVYVTWDATSPVKDSCYPNYNDTIINAKPTLWAAFHDAGGSGINTDSLRFILNGSVVPGTWDGTSKYSHAVTTDLADLTWHYFKVRAVDQAGNALPGDSVPFLVNRTGNDNIAPVISNPSPLSTQTTDKPFIRVLAQDYENGLNESSIKLWIDNVPKIYSYNNGTHEITYQITIPLSQGWHRCSVYVEDASSNRNPARSAWSFLIDSYAPPAPQVNALATPTRNAYVTVSGTTTEPRAAIQVFRNGESAASGNADASGVFSIPSVPMVEGANAIQVTAADSLNNTSAYSSQLQVFMDSTKPVILSLSPADGDTVGTRLPTFSIQVADGSGSGVNPDSLFLKIAADTIAPSLISYSSGAFSYQQASAKPLGQGTTVTYYASARDYAGNACAVLSASFFVDTNRLERNPPVFSGPAPAPGTAVNTGTLDIRVGVSDVSGILSASVRMELNGSPVAAAFSGGEIRHSASGLADGFYTVKAVATDGSPSANRDSITWGFSVDSRAPDRPTLNQAGSPTNAQQITVTGNAENKSLVTLLRGTDTLARAAANSSGAFSAAVLLVEGDNRITASAADTAGNVSSVSLAMTVVLDTRTPQILSVYPSDGQVVSSDRPVISAQIADSGGALDTARLYLSLFDNTTGDTVVGDADAAYNGSTGILSAQPVSALLNSRNYTIYITVYDLAGNSRSQSSAFSTNFTMGDQEKPQITSFGPTGTVKSRTPEISAIVSDNTKLDLAAMVLKVDTVAVAFSFDTLLAKVIYQASAPMAEALEHTVELTAKDTAGNTKTQGWSFTIDATPPSTPVLDPVPDFSKSLTASVSGRAEARAAVEIVILGVKAGSGAADDSGKFTASSVALNEGQNVLYAQAVDNAGNKSGLSQPDTVFADIRPPYLSSSSPRSGDTVGLTPQIMAQIADTGKSSGLNPATVSFLVDGRVVRTTYAGGTARVDTVLVLTAGQQHSYSVQASDFAGNSLASSQIVFNADSSYLDNVPPVFSGLTPANNSTTGSARPAVSITISDASSSIDSASVKLLIELSPVSGYSFTPSTGVLAYTPSSDLTQGVKNIMVIAADVAGNKDTVEWKFLVDIIPPARPVFLTAKDTLVAATFVTLKAVSQVGSNVSLFRDSVLLSDIQNLSSDTFIIPDVPVQKGVNRFHLIAFDGVGNASVPSETVSVVYNTAPPVIGNAMFSSVIAVEDSSLALQIIASDADGNRLYYQIFDPVQPESIGMAIDSNGLLTWSPSLPQAANLNVYIRVHDGFGLADTVVLRMTATPVNDAPVITGLADTSVLRVDSVRIPFVISDEDNATLTSFGVKNPPDASMRIVHGTGNNYTLVFYADSAFADTVRLYAFDGTDSVFAQLYIRVNLQAASRTLTFAGTGDTLRFIFGFGQDTIRMAFPYDPDIAGRILTVERMTPSSSDTIGGNIRCEGPVYGAYGLEGLVFDCQLELRVPSTYIRDRSIIRTGRRPAMASPWETVLDRDSARLPAYVSSLVHGFSQFTLFADTIPPRIRIDSVNTRYQVYSTVTENIRNPLVTLNYRRPGQAAVRHGMTAITASGSVSCVDSVPAAFAAAADYGFEYWLTVTDGGHTVSTTHRFMGKTIAGASVPASAVPLDCFRMVSLPFIAGTQSADSVFKPLIGADTLAWRIGRWRATGFNSGDYVDLVPGSPDAFLNLLPGAAVWVYSKAGSASSLPLGNALSTPIVMTDSMTQGYEVPLRTGWNQVGNPYHFPIKASDVVLDTSRVQDVFYAWSAGAYVTADTLLPYDGYFVLAHSADTILFPSLPPSLAKAASGCDSTAWSAGIRVSGPEGANLVRIGESSVGTEDRNPGLDLIGPPAITAGISLTLPHKEWKAWASACYVQDIRSSASEGNVWAVKVSRHSAAGTAVYALSLDDKAAVPAGENMVAYFPELMMKADLKGSKPAQIVLAGNETGASFSIVAGSAAYVDRMTLGALEPPSRTDVAQNYPNPFNPMTRIRYQIKDAGKVTLTVYDMKGRIVGRLLDRFHKPGYFSVAWQGKNGKGVPVASGLYVYRLQAGRFTKTCRMLMVK